MPKANPFLVAIDPGSTRTRLAHVESSGRVVLTDLGFDRSMPSVVFFDNTGLLVGDGARQAARSQPTLAAERFRLYRGKALLLTRPDGQPFTSEEAMIALLRGVAVAGEETLDHP